MKQRDREIAARLAAGLNEFARTVHPLPGIEEREPREVLLRQMIESIHRVRYVDLILCRDISPRRSDPGSILFDPIKAAIWHLRNGEVNEAFWLVFLFVHFGKHPRGGWRYAREVYGRLGDTLRWDWESVSHDPTMFRQWLSEHQAELRRPATPGGFGNHRKHESLDANSPNGTGAVVESYVRWVGPSRDHAAKVDAALQEARGDPRRAFDLLYHSMREVRRFGRTARFDYLTMLAKLRLAPIAPGSAYLNGATGPLRGARLLFAGDPRAPISPSRLDPLLVQLDGSLSVGMQVLEDSLCNWQKSPTTFRPFRG